MTRLPVSDTLRGRLAFFAGRWGTTTEGALERVLTEWTEAQILCEPSGADAGCFRAYLAGSGASAWAGSEGEARAALRFDLWDEEDEP